jgi:4-amino-4-deoxy-L-arabinose transferase-like glycosyltransferase
VDPIGVLTRRRSPSEKDFALPRLDRRAFALLLVALWALAYLPHLGTRDLRLEEGRRATVAREMLASGDFVRPTLYGDTYLHKPPLHPWLIAAFGSLLGGVNPVAVRLPSALAALGCALVALRFAPDVLDRRTRNLAGLLVLATATILDKGTLGEIDATLCLLVAAALKCWWDGYRPAGQTSRSWLLVGLLLGAAGLLKGPAGPALFYLTVGPFLVWQRDTRRLFTRGHLGCLVLAVLPAAAWVGELLDRGVVSGPHLLAIWAHQVGAGGAVGAPADPEERAHVIGHYLGFLPQLAGMFFPAALWLPLALRRRWAEGRGIPESLRRFLVCAVVGPAVAFYVYPEARPRHLMPVAFPAAMLAAVVVTGWARTAGRRPVVFAASLAGVLLAGWAGFNVVVVPWLAPRAPTRVALREVEGKIPPNEPVYTTRTFPVTAEGYYNLQFHLAKDIRAADVGRLKRLAPCLAVVTPEERAELEREGFVVEEVGRLTARGGPAEVHVVRVSPRAKASRRP